MNKIEIQPAQELKTPQAIISELNSDGFVVLEVRDSFLGKLGNFFADKVKPAATRVALPASVVLLTVAAACSSGESNASDIQTSNLSEVPAISEAGNPEPPRRNNPPARITEDSIINLPKELPIPEGTRIVIGSCSSDGKCMPNDNFYWEPTEEIVFHSGQREDILLHEACHAHQDWSIMNDENHLQESTDLKSWYQTGEGKSFIKAVEGLPWIWTEIGPENILEDFAWTCGYFYFDPHYLQETSPQRYEWAIKNLPTPEPNS